MSNGLHNGLYNGILNGSGNGAQSDVFVPKVPSEIGTIFTDSFARASVGSAYTTTGAGTWTCDGVKLTNTGSTGAYTNNLYRNANPTCLERHLQIIDFKITNVPNSTSFGLGVGILGTNPNDKRGYVLRCVTDIAALQGKTILDTSDSSSGTFSNRKTSTSSFSISQNNVLRIIVERDVDRISWSFHNFTTGQAYSDSYLFPYTFGGGAYTGNATGVFSLYAFGGTFEITNWTVSSKEIKNCKTLFIGDSITYGFFGSAVKSRWANKLMGDTLSKYVVSAGGSDKTNEVLAKINELLLFKPKYAILMIGGNDYYYGVADVTVKANYESIVLRLKSQGITVIHCLATPRTILDLRTWNAYLMSKYSSTDIVIQNTFNHLTTTPGSTFDLKAIYDSGDGAHPNALGHAAIANAIYQEVPYIR